MAGTRARAAKAATGSSTSSRISQEISSEPSAPVAREPAGGGWPGRYLPVRTPWERGDHTIWPMPSFSQRGTTSASITRQSSEYWGWLDTMRSKPMSSAIRSASAICSAVHSETPTEWTLPWRTRSSKARMVSSSGVSKS